MIPQYNIFVEGIPGSGKTTLLNSLAENLTNYTIYREGDISPVELAWCSYMSKEEFQKTLFDMSEMKNEIENNTRKENTHFITAYTKIHVDNYDFYQYMEQYEIYGGRRSICEVKEIILQRFGHFDSIGNLFECSFLQNIIEELMLFAMFSDKQIVDFYKDIISLLDLATFKMIRLVCEDVTSSIAKIKQERVNDKGEEIWYSLMINYLRNSPYGKENNIYHFADLIAHFHRRTKLEEEVLRLLPSCNYINIKNKNFELSDILNNFIS